ncbi:unnamed protein product, partial [Acanthoscelides obtectus]
SINGEGRQLVIHLLEYFQEENENSGPLLPTLWREAFWSQIDYIQRKIEDSLRVVISFALEGARVSLMAEVEDSASIMLSLAPTETGIQLRRKMCIATLDRTPNNLVIQLTSDHLKKPPSTPGPAPLIGALRSWSLGSVKLKLLPKNATLMTNFSLLIPASIQFLAAAAILSNHIELLMNCSVFLVSLQRSENRLLLLAADPPIPNTQSEDEIEPEEEDDSNGEDDD